MAMASGWRGILGFDYGIVQAPLGPDISGAELVAAVANAGAIGLLRLPDWPAPDHVRELIRKTRSLTSKPFGAAIVLARAFPHEENLRVVLEEKLAVLQVYWGDFPKERVQEAHRAGVKVLHQVGSLEEAAKAKEAGVDGIIVQGREAGGHVIGQEGLFPLLPRVVDLVSDSGIPVIAAGGIVDGRGYVAALALGAQAVCLGTRFVATEESFAHPIYKQKLIEMSHTDYTNILGRARWPDAPQRVLETPFYAEWKNNFPDEETEENQPIIGHSIIHGVPAPDYVRELIRKTRGLTSRPFGAAIVLPFLYEEDLRVVLEEKLAVLQVYCGEFPREWVQEAHRAGVKVLHQHEGLIPLLPRVVDLVSDSGIPVIAAGGIVDGRGYVAALAFGARGVCLGTRWSYAPQRVLETPFYSGCKNLPDQETEENQPIIGHSIIHGVHKDIHRFPGIAPNPTATGDIGSMVMYAGQSVGLITEIIPAGEVVRRLVAEAKDVIRERLSDFH
ncbi:uncharacterized protein [Miscanthus floridulus]|uniref:uncharacterized protein isoform X2 n=1 Tax=Miscanthus floridulus TaxID=154761 RepID=UPI0034597CA3